MSTFSKWQDAVKSIKKLMRPRTESQAELAKHCGLNIKEREPEILLAARLKEAFANELCINEQIDPNNLIFEYLAYLAKSAGRKNIPSITSRSLAEAWVYYLQLSIRKSALINLKIVAGDIVETARGPAEVCSIGHDGCVYFRGGRGLRAWPDTIAVKERNSSEAETSLRKIVRSEAAKRSQVKDWSIAKSKDLKPFELRPTSMTSTEIAIEEFELILDKATDERPLQDVLEKHPYILGALLGRTPRYIIPRPRLGDSYIPDFLLVDVDSSGAQWTFVELESPSANIYIKNGKEFSSNARTGIAQVKEWRRWAASNRDLAWRSRSNGGLGFPDIDENALGLVIVGRDNSLLEEGNPLRRQLKSENRIELRSYDGILAQVRNSLEFNGPPLFNNFLLRNMSEASFDD